MKASLLFLALFASNAWAGPRHEIERALGQYKKRCGQYPTTEQGLGALVEAPDRAPACPRYPKRGFMKGGKIPLDPGGHPFVYNSDGEAFTLTSEPGQSHE